MQSAQTLTAQMEGSDRPGSSWVPWAAPLALVCGLVLGALGALVVDIPAWLAGVNISASKLPPGLELADTAVQDIMFVVAAVLCARIGGGVVRSWQFGLRAARLWRSLLLVLVTLLAFFVFFIAWSAIFHVSTKQKLLEQLGANESVLLLVLSAALTTVLAPICEEFLFRGFVFTALRNWRGPLPAAILTGAAFGLFHLGSAPVVDIVPLAVLGFSLCVVYWKSGSLYPCIAIHAVNNSIAFGSLEGWHLWQGVVLAAAVLSLIGLSALALTRLGVLAAAPARQVAR